MACHIRFLIHLLKLANGINDAGRCICYGKMEYNSGFLV